MKLITNLIGIHSGNIKNICYIDTQKYGCRLHPFTEAPVDLGRGAAIALHGIAPLAD